MISSPQIIETMRRFMEVAVHYSMRSSAHFTKAMGLSMPQFSILMQLYYRGNCGMSEVSERFEISPAAASQLVDKLVQNGWIHREEDPHDRRAKSLKLTDKGKKLIQEGIENRYHWVEPLAEKLTPEQRVTIQEALTLIMGAAKELEAAHVQHAA